MKKIRCSQMNHWYIFIWLVAYKDSWLFFSEGGWQSYTHTLLTSGILLLEIQTSPFLYTNPQPHQEKYTKLFRYTLFLLLFLSFELFPFQPISLHRWNHGTKFYRLLFVMQTFFCITVFIIIISLGLL